MNILSTIKLHTHHHTHTSPTLLLMIILILLLYIFPARSYAFSTNPILANLPVNITKMIGKYTSSQLSECVASSFGITAYSRWYIHVNIRN